jgi:hypothetical protein
MTFDFYADYNDKIAILEFIFNNTDHQVFDLGSAYGKEIKKYGSTDEIVSILNLIDGNKFAVTFELWTPRHKGKPLFRKINLDPDKSNGHTFRYSTDGWGMIQLYFGGIKNDTLHLSHLGHFTEKGAMKWEGTNTFNGSVRDWSWKEIETTSKKIKQFIKTNLVVQKIGGIDVLTGAAKLHEKGIQLK